GRGRGRRRGLRLTLLRYRGRLLIRHSSLRRQPDLALLSARHGGADLAQHLGQPRSQRVADRGQQLAGGFLLTALDLGEVPQADVRRGGALTQGPVLSLSARTQSVADHPTQQDHGPPPFRGIPQRYLVASRTTSATCGSVSVSLLLPFVGTYGDAG